ncbi:flavin reductase family protein [Gemmiger formicilis]|uniref:flavin reductase family protein n=1 Tax=Gemmiger formicilis TaxID=745368 RepID=UPI00195AC4E5|nr:flavin reductase family protein [Gemmiger formicilis]MBM6914124.1 flavin reductase family protein [Gemmiger formicilis]HIX32511.1 flavin reductase family protein [Candidatus Gemmiger avium]
MSKQVWKPGNLLAPVPPVLVSCGNMEKPNLITIAWAGTINSDPVRVSISVRPERYSHGLITESGEFVINLPTQKILRAVDWCGVKSGRDVDKFKEMGLTAVPGSAVSAPVLAESPVNLECRVFQTIPLGSHDLFLADVVAVDVDEDLLDEAGRLRLDKAGLAAYVHGTYYALGKQLGTFGYSVRKKPARRRK